LASSRTAFKADRAEVSMLETEGSTALTYINRLSIRVEGNLVMGLNKGYAAFQQCSKTVTPPFLKTPLNTLELRGFSEEIVTNYSPLLTF
jgi:hypothetical protein